MTAMMGSVDILLPAHCSLAGEQVTRLVHLLNEYIFCSFMCGNLCQREYAIYCINLYKYIYTDLGLAVQSPHNVSRSYLFYLQ